MGGCELPDVGTENHILGSCAGAAHALTVKPCLHLLMVEQAGHGEEDKISTWAPISRESL